MSTLRQAYGTALLLLVGSLPIGVAAQPTTQALPAADRGLPRALSAAQGTALRLRQDLIQRRSDRGAYVRLVVYSADCECDSGEPTATRLGVYVGRGDAPGTGALVLERAFLIRGESQSERALVEANLEAERDGARVLVSAISYRNESASAGGAGRRWFKQRTDTAIAISWSGAQGATGPIAPAATTDETRWLVAGPEHASQASAIARALGIAMWRADLAPDGSLVLSPSAGRWVLGPFLWDEDLAAAGSLLTARLRERGVPGSPLRQLTARRLVHAGPRPFVVAKTGAAGDASIELFRAAWRGAVARRDTSAFTALFLPAHLHVNRVGTRSDYGSVLQGREVTEEAARMFTCVMRANETLGAARFDAVTDGRRLRGNFPQTLSSVPVARTITAHGVLCAPDDPASRYEMSVVLGWIGNRWFVLDVYLHA